MISIPSSAIHPFILIPTLPEVSPFTLLWFHPYCQWIAEWEAFSVSPSGFSELENSPAHSSGNRMVVDKPESWDDIHGAWRYREHQGHLPRIARGSVQNKKKDSNTRTSSSPEPCHLYFNLFFTHFFSPLTSFISHPLRGNLEFQTVPSLILHLYQP